MPRPPHRLDAAIERQVTARDAAVLHRLTRGPVWRTPETVAAEAGVGVRAATGSMRRLRAAGLAARRIDPHAGQRERTMWAHTGRANRHGR